MKVGNVDVCHSQKGEHGTMRGLEVLWLGLGLFNPRREVSQVHFAGQKVVVTEIQELRNLAVDQGPGLELANVVPLGGGMH